MTRATRAFLPGRVLVTGADQHQGLAVIRGLGAAGYQVIAAGSEPDAIGFASRHVADRRLYASPFLDPARCTADLLRIIDEVRPAVVIPSIEATVVLLSAVREQLPRETVLALPPTEVLEQVLDKGNTLALAARCGVPAPRTARGDTIETLLASAGALSFPVALKPRGNSLHRTTANTLGFKARYAATFSELRHQVRSFPHEARALLVQEYAPGTGRCVAAVCDQGRPLALFAYARDREVPLSGGVSVVRRSIPLDMRLEAYTRALLSDLRWHGVAMVEFKYDAVRDAYALMEINGRFQASTALALDAGVNLPHLVAVLFGAGGPLPAVASYRIGVEERWLRGDLLALAGAWRDGHGGRATAAPTPHFRLGATLAFLKDFRPGMHYDEFKWRDHGPGLAELRAWGRALRDWIYARVAAAWRRARPVLSFRRATRASMHRSIRA